MPHSETHRVDRIGWLRAAVLGANDGLVSTASLVVGVAARLQELAEPGRPMVAEGTARLVEGYFALRDLGPSHLRGVPEPVAIYELEGAGRLKTRLDVSRARGLTRFVGRSDAPSAYDRRHVLGAALGYDWGGGFRSGVRGSFYTGEPADVAYLEAARNPPRTRPFYRIDLRSEKRFTWGDDNYLSIVLEIVNSLPFTSRRALPAVPPATGTTVSGGAIQ